MITGTSATGFLVERGVFEPTAALSVEPLAGGVSSDICVVSDGLLSVVVKTPLAQLKVAEDWQAPLERSDSEAAWLSVAARLVPGICPEVLAHDEERHLLALSYLDPLTHRLWKSDLLLGSVDVGFAALVGDRVGAVQRLSAQEPSLADRFANDELFRALRIAPYFESAADRHPDLRPAITEVIATTMTNPRVLGHGDVSPKNILVGPHGPVLLDAETASWGDPAFDVAFCLNHLLLKCLVPATSTPDLLDAAHGLLRAYLRHVEWESPVGVEGRIAHLLPALLLARVDGRSPVEYLDGSARDRTREFARGWLLSPADTLFELTNAWKEAVR